MSHIVLKSPMARSCLRCLQSAVYTTEVGTAAARIHMVEGWEAGNREPTLALEDSIARGGTAEEDSKMAVCDGYSAGDRRVGDALPS